MNVKLSKSGLPLQIHSLNSLLCKSLFINYFYLISPSFLRSCLQVMPYTLNVHLYYVFPSSSFVTPGSYGTHMSRTEPYWSALSLSFHNTSIKRSRCLRCSRWAVSHNELWLELRSPSDTEAAQINWTFLFIHICVSCLEMTESVKFDWHVS